jgi:ribosomal protein S18 acetylase RimI-like enzyme
MALGAVTYEEGFRPGYLGRMIQMQGEYYDVVWAVPGHNFECMMARQMCDFHNAYVPGRDLLLTAHVGGVMAGHIAVVGFQVERPGARLRWFHIDEKYRGHGIGRELLTRAIDFCRRQGYKTVWLWTMDGLDTARHLYISFGFKTVASVDSALPFHGVTMELMLE